MKKSSLLLAALLTVALAACGKNDEPAAVATPAPAPAPAPKAQPATPAEAPTAQQPAVATEAAEAATETTQAAETMSDKAATAVSETMDEAKSMVENAAEEASKAVDAAVESAAQAVGMTGVAPLSAVDAENLAKARNCMACHAVDRKLVGPAYKEVAAKRAGEEGAIATLAEKIQKGGSGVYGPVPMPPNTQVNAEEASQLAQWVLSLN